MTNPFRPVSEGTDSSLPLGMTPLNDEALENAHGGLLLTGLVVAGVTLAVADRFLAHRRRR